MRVLFNQGLSNVHHAIALIHQAMRPGEFHLVASYGTRHTPLRTVADTFLPEPRTANGDVYLDWLLTCCQQQGIDLFWPQSRLPLIFAHRQRFVAKGVQVLLPCPNADILAIIDDKRRAAERLSPLGIAFPQWRSFRTVREFDAALAELGYPQRSVCIKPAQGLYAQGFRILDEKRSPFERFMSNEIWRIHPDELRGLLANNHRDLEFLAMEYLSGDERSIDCLVSNGQLVCSVTRCKPRAAAGRFEVIEDHPVGQQMAARICQAFQLNGLINIQTCDRRLPDAGQQTCFLEVNARMSGGINMSCLSGLALPYWALRLAIGDAIRPPDLPRPRNGLRVTTTHQALALDDGSDAWLDLENIEPPSAKP